MFKIRRKKKEKEIQMHGILKKLMNITSIARV